MASAALTFVASSFNALAADVANSNLNAGFRLVSSSSNIPELDTAQADGQFDFLLALYFQDNFVVFATATRNGLLDAYRDASNTGNVYSGDAFDTAGGL